MRQHTVIPHSRPEITGGDIRAVVAALRSGRLSDGTEVERLETKLAAMFDGAEAVAVSSGTAALYLALVALGIGKGRKVIIPSYTCNSLYSAARYAGAEPVCADSAEDGLSISRETVERVMEKAVGAIIVPHTCGYLSDISAIRALGAPVIEDCAQSIGGYYPDGSRVGARGDAAVFSFFATKLVPAGEGGACVTRNAGVARIIRELRDCDKKAPDPRAFNFKMSDVTAALARSKLKQLVVSLKKHECIAQQYDRAFGKRSFRASSRQTQSVCFRYILDIEGRTQKFLDGAASLGIRCMRPIWRPLHRSIGGNCPNVESLEKRLVSVPVYPGLKKSEIGEICEKLRSLL